MMISNEPEEWRTIPDFQDYEVSNLGHVRSKPRIRVDHGGRNGGRRERKTPGVLLATAPCKGYPSVSLSKDSKGHTRAVHRLVMEAFVGPKPDGMECRHLDGNRANPRLGNLAWGTPVENQADRNTHGTSNIGEQHPLSKLTEDQVMQIRRLADENVTHPVIARQFRVTRSCVQSIVSRRMWKHLP